LSSAAFVAIDEEMTGITLPGQGRPRKDQSPSQRYEEALKQVPEHYSIIQLGISLFHPVVTTAAPAVEVEEGEEEEAVPEQHHSTTHANTTTTTWHVRKYNFYMFPSQYSHREVTLNPSAVAFLHQHNMSFDLWSRDGVPYTTTNSAHEELTKYVAREQEFLQKQDATAVVIPDAARRGVELRRDDDIHFHANAMARLREWLDAAHPTENNTMNANSFLLPPCNSFLRRAFYENIGKEYPNLILEAAGREFPNQIRVLRLTAAEKNEREKLLRQTAWEELIAEKVGMWRVFDALSKACRGVPICRQSPLFASCYDRVDFDHVPADSTEKQGRKIPLVAHNGFMDICFLLTHFHDPILPDTLSECKSLISSYFPAIYDTKVVSTECTMAYSHDNNLGNLFQSVVASNDNVSNQFFFAAQHDSSTQALPDQEHEAAYDAYMTGAIFVGLCMHINELYQLEEPNASDAGAVGDLVHLLSDHNSSLIRSRYGCNKLYQMSLYTLDLNEMTDDPLKRGMLAECTYRVSGIDPSVDTREIVRCVGNLFDENNRKVEFDIVWVDDTTFFVAAVFREESGVPADAPVESDAFSTNGNENAVLKNHGEIVRKALCTRFRNHEEIVSLDEHVKNLRSAKDEKESKGWIESALDFLGLGFVADKRKAGAFDGEPNAKRQRRN
jgi:hypothetical protein